jgi:hypothetical protein
MGQKSNTITLRKVQKNLSFWESEKESKQFLYGLKFSFFLEQLLSRKNILLVDKTINFVNSQCFFNFTLFFRMSKLAVLKKKITKTYKVHSFSKNINLIKLFFKQLSYLRTNLVLLNFKNINKDIDANLVKLLYQKIGRFAGVLFSRRFNLLIDFVKIASLFCEKKVPLQTFLSMLGQIFRILPKRKHNRFFFFLKYLFGLIVSSSELKSLPTMSNICGIKFVVNGKLQGKTRADSTCIQVGAVPIQSLDKSIEFSRLHVYTLYGVFGFRMWIYRKN